LNKQFLRAKIDLSVINKFIKHSSGRVNRILFQNLSKEDNKKKEQAYEVIILVLYFKIFSLSPKE